MPFVSRRKLNSQGNVVPMDAGSSTPDVSELAGSPLELPGAIGGVFGRVAKVSADDLGLLGDLLGRPIQLGKRLMRLSSVNPQKGMLILHDVGTGERVATPIQDFLKRWRTIGQESEEPFPEGAVLSQPGARADGGTLGPRGGMSPLRRTIPPTSTR